MPPITRAQAYAVLGLCGVAILFLCGGRLRSRMAPPVPTLAVASGTEVEPERGHSRSAPKGAAAPAAAQSPAQREVTPARRATVVVHVAGCVRAPGVYSLPEGSRIADAIRRAGGAKPHADLDALNLAARLEDATQVYVPRRLPAQGAAKQAAASPAPPGRVPLRQAVSPAANRPVGSQSGKITSAAQGRISINHADEAELQRLPGVGPATARRIIEYRRTHGPFESVDQLLEVRGIGEKRLARLRELVQL